MFSCAFAWIPKVSTKTYFVTVYFVVYPTSSVAASTSEIALRGGAGYALADDQVAFGVYFSQDSATDCVKRLRNEYPTAQVKSCDIAFDGENLANIVCGILQVIDGWIKALENGVRQSVVKNGLLEVTGLLNRVGEESGKTVFFNLSPQLLDVSKGIVYACELRHFLCFMVDSIASLI